MLLLLFRAALAQGLSCADVAGLLDARVPGDAIVSAIQTAGLVESERDCILRLPLPGQVAAFLRGTSAKEEPITIGTVKGIQYALVMGAEIPFSHKVAITIDYGQATARWAPDYLRDEEGRLAKFNSMVDAMNYMASEGWRFVFAYAFSVGNQQVYHYLFTKVEE